ncbi:salicylate 5-hydroxylase, large oxygenase component [bacterium MnTg03]|nr:salicylate 5-hydroxylase, large oxygenase component [bacterium MnTg03]
MNHSQTELEQIYLSLESILKPIEAATGLPNQAYTSASFIEYERDHVLGSSWAGLWFASDLPKKGTVKPVDFMGLPLLIMRNKSDQINVFHNVCSHRGMKLVSEEMVVQGALRCPYHSWSYNLDGELKGTPHIGGVGQHKVEGFNHCDHGLKPVRSAVWMDIVFINLSGDAIDFAEYIKPLTDHWHSFLGDTGLDRLIPAVNSKGLQIDIQSNWKLAVENYCESYHLPWIHPGLNTYSPLEDHYHIMIGDNFAGQGSNSYRPFDDAGTALPQFPEWSEDKLEQAEYVSFYPNVLLGIQADHVFVLIIEPVAQDKSVEHLRLLYVGEEALGDGHSASRNAILESWRVVFGEDIGVVEGMQKGRSSPGYRGGVFSPVMDNPTHHFHQWVARKLVAVA